MSSPAMFSGSKVMYAFWVKNKRSCVVQKLIVKIFTKQKFQKYFQNFWDCLITSQNRHLKDKTDLKHIY